MIPDSFFTRKEPAVSIRMKGWAMTKEQALKLGLRIFEPEPCANCQTLLDPDHPSVTDTDDGKITCNDECLDYYIVGREGVATDWAYEMNRMVA